MVLMKKEEDLNSLLLLLHSPPELFPFRWVSFISKVLLMIVSLRVIAIHCTSDKRSVINFIYGSDGSLLLYRPPSGTPLTMTFVKGLWKIQERLSSISLIPILFNKIIQALYSSYHVRSIVKMLSISKNKCFGENGVLCICQHTTNLVKILLHLSYYFFFFKTKFVSFS